MAAQIGFNEVSLNQKYDTADEAGSASEVRDLCLECNICLDSAHEPVVTLCGHLYCWPCIYQWLDVQGSYDESPAEPKCPICKSGISASTLVPLYGRGDAFRAGSRISEQGLDVPKRPAFNLRNLQQSSNSTYSTHRREQLNPTFASPSSPQLDPETLSAFLNPMACKFGEMVYARIFGGDASLYPHIAASTNPRIRRQEKEVEKSLNRLSFFFLCCMLLCLCFF